MHIPLRRLLVAAIVLTTGCRSEKAAFEFTAPALTIAATAAPAPGTAAEPPAALPAPAVVTGAATLVRLPQPVALAVRSARRLPVARPHAETTAHRATASRRQLLGDDDEIEHKTLHLILGGLLVVGGVVGGILLGGWLGLGVGAAVVLGGYYFLGLAFGGKHAWLGVFQEFFNM